MDEKRSGGAGGLSKSSGSQAALNLHAGPNYNKGAGGLGGAGSANYNNAGARERIRHIFPSSTLLF